MADLLNCPFCGGQAEYVPAFGVKCTACGLALPCTEAEAIAAWNTRATPAPAAMTPEVAKVVEAAINLAGWVNNNVGGKPDHLMEHLEALDEALTSLRAGGDA